MTNLKLWFKVAIRVAALLPITLVAGFMIRIGFEIISSYLGDGVGFSRGDLRGNCFLHHASLACGDHR